MSEGCRGPRFAEIQLRKIEFCLGLIELVGREYSLPPASNNNLLHNYLLQGNVPTIRVFGVVELAHSFGKLEAHARRDASEAESHLLRRFSNDQQIAARTCNGSPSCAWT